MDPTKTATQQTLRFAIAMAQRFIPITPVPMYPDSSQAWVVPSPSAYKPALRKNPLFPDARRMLVSLRSVGGSNNTLHDECDDATDIPGVPRSTSSSMTSEGSQLLTPQDRCGPSARWVHGDDFPEEECSAGYVVDPFREMSLDGPAVQKELVTAVDDKHLALKETGATAASFASFTWVRALGEGGYAATVAVREERGRKHYKGGQAKGRLLCLKIFVKSVMEKQDLLFGVQRELLAYQALASVDRGEGGAFVMELDGALEDPARIYFAMELMKYDLMAVLTEGKPGKKQNKRRWIAQIAAGLDALHAAGIIHRDIKPENLMVDCRNNIRIADLGASYVSPRRERLLAAGAYADQLLGTWPYIAPEVLDTRGKPRHQRKAYGPAVDYWALGCIAFELETPGSPLLFETEEDLDLYRSWEGEQAQGLSSLAAARLPPKVESLILGLVHLDPRRRYDISDLRRHNYFRIDEGMTEFDNIEKRALDRPTSCLDESGDAISRLDCPPSFRPIMRIPTGPVDPSSFDNLCWLNPRGVWAS